jgi:hypothetical protein
MPTETYYRMAFNLHRFDRLKWVMETSLTKTLAAKLRISVPKVYDRYQAVLRTPDGPYKGLRATVEREGKRPLVAEWGGIALKRNLDAALDDHPAPVRHGRTELEQRLLADECELCGSRTNVEVHHIRALKDLKTRGRAEKPAWVRAMAARQRKTLVVCRTCHQDIQYGRPFRRVNAAYPTAPTTSSPSARTGWPARGARSTDRRGAPRRNSSKARRTCCG